LLSQWEEQWGKKLTQELARQAERVPTHHVRLNRLHPDFLVTRERCLKELAPLEGREDVFRVDKVPYELLKSGAAYLQDPSTLRACELLAPLPGERVLDACASPGGKTAYLAQMMNDSGKIIAVDLTDKRVERLKENLDRLCVTNAEVHKWDWRQKDSHWKAFDRILVDVPCSNTGVINRRVDVRWRLQKGTSKSMSAE